MSHSSASDHGGPMTCIPIGIPPLPNPHGNATDGNPHAAPSAPTGSE